MSERWERSVKDWYDNARTSNLEYLDLHTVTKSTKAQLSHNQDVIYDRLNLQSRVHLRNFKEILEKLFILETKFQNLAQTLARAQKDQNPLSESQIKTLFVNLSQKPKEIEAEALALSKELERKISRVETVLHKVEAWLSA